MENEPKILLPKQKKHTAGKKKGNKPSANPAGRGKAKGLLQNFKNNTLASKSAAVESKKPIVEGMNTDKFKNLLGMFDKKPEDKPIEDNKPSFGKINSDRMSMFNKDNNIEESKQVSENDAYKPNSSIKDRINSLMKSKDDSKITTRTIDPILEKLRENVMEDDEDSYDNLSDDLDISEGEENDDLEKSENLSEVKSEKIEKEEDNKKDEENKVSLEAKKEHVSLDSEEKDKKMIRKNKIKKIRLN